MSQGFKTVRQKIEVEEGKRNKRVPGFVVDMSGHNVLQPNPMTDDEFKNFFAAQGQKRTKFDSVIEKAIKWIAVESKYMSDVKKDLEALQSELKAPSRRGWLSFFSGSNGTKLVRKALKDFRMVGRCERREARLDKEIENMLEELKGQVSATGSLHELEALKVKIETEARSILKETSFYEGGIKTKLENIKKEITTYGKAGEYELSCMMNELNELYKDIDRVLEWMNALTINLRQARSASERYFAAIYPKVYFGGNEPHDNKTTDLLRGEGAYKLYSLEHRRLVWNKWRVNGKKRYFTQVSLMNANLSGLDLSGFDMRKADLRGADLSHTTLTSTNLSEAAMERAKLSHATMNQTILRVTLLPDAKLVEAKLNNCDLSYADLTRANLRGMVMTGGSASVARFVQADFTDAVVTGTQMDGAIFTGAKLKGAKTFLPKVISLADFRGTGLKDSDLGKIIGVGLAKF
ncbi:MAG TPA: pentapeptide repeat-containing protein [Candidatus Nanoarchaeia archaeon]|nr:pentapeptide repeat-containing protein [Candidatus Nanoarchaeia archaeon]